MRAFTESRPIDGFKDRAEGVVDAVKDKAEDVADKAKDMLPGT